LLTQPQPPRIHLPKGWQDFVNSAVLHAIALAHYAIVYARAWAADSINARVRLAAENDRLYEECALLRGELRIKDTRIARSRLSDARITAPMSVWRSSNFVPRVAGPSNKRPKSFSLRKLRLHRG
jgi:hypothetical protein